MQTQLYVIRDSKAKVYNKPFHQTNRDVALRTATDLANDPNQETSKHPEDYALFYLGTYDDEHAQIDLVSQPELVCKFHELAHG